MLSLKDCINESPSLLIFLNLKKPFAISVLGSLFFLIKALEFAKWAGNIISASINEINRVRITTTETSLKNSPILPSKNKNNEKANMVVIIAETTGGRTSKTPSTAAR